MSKPTTTFALLVVVGLWGCGGPPPGPKRYPASGKVTFGGKPVPKGSVTFSPDTTAGNSGPGTTALIKDGAYQTEPDKGTVGGPHLIRIYGYDGVSNEDSADGKPLFPEYRTPVELPKDGEAKKDFDVPTKSAPA